jgi:hypothetical protein
MNLDQELRAARRAFAAGQWTIGELTCRGILLAHPDCAAALGLLGSIAAAAGEAELAVGFFAQADAHRPALQNLFLGGGAIQRKWLLHKARKRKADAGPAKRYLVIKSWGCGFWSDVSQVLGGLLLAEITHRTPVVHWGNNSLFGDRSGRDAFRNYFEPVSDVSLFDLRQLDDATFFPKKWTKTNLRHENFAKWEGVGSRLGAVEFLNRPETIAVMDFYINVVNTAPWLPASHSMHGRPVNEIYSYLAAKYLHPRSSVLSRCDSFYKTYLAGTPFVAVHLRGSDKTIEDKNLAASNRKIRDAVASVPDGWRVFLLTDDERLLSEMRDLHGDRLITTDCQRSSTETGAHYLSSTDRVEAGLEMMTDSYLALRADKFIGNGRSNVAAMISVLRDWAPGDCMLLGEAQIARPNLAVYRARRSGGTR